MINVRLKTNRSKGSEAGKKIFQTNLYHFAGTSHLAIDYAKLMKVGYNGLIEQAKECLGRLDKRDPEYGDKRDFYQAMIIMHEAAKKYLERYAKAGGGIRGEGNRFREKERAGSDRRKLPSDRRRSTEDLLAGPAAIQHCNHTDPGGKQRPLHLLRPHGPVAVSIL